MLNKAPYTSGGGPRYENIPDTDSEPPTPPSKSPSLIARLTTPKPQLAPRSLSPIPGTPVTAVNPNSTHSLPDSSGDDYRGGSPHVRFRSPVASARGCSPLPSNHSSGAFSKVFDHHHYPPPSVGPSSGGPWRMDLYGKGSDESFDPYKHHRPFGYTS